MQPPAARGVFISATTVSPPTGHWLVLRPPCQSKRQVSSHKTTRPLAVLLTQEAGDDAHLGCFRIYRNPRMDWVRSRWGLASQLSGYGSGSRTTHQLCSRVSSAGIRGAPWVNSRGLKHGAPRYPIPSGKFARCEAGELRDVKLTQARWQTSASCLWFPPQPNLCLETGHTPPRAQNSGQKGPRSGICLRPMPLPWRWLVTRRQMAPRG